TPMVNIQNAPGVPAPGAGLAGLSELLGKAGIFKDITGLDATQQMALKTYLSNQENAKAFAEMAKEMAMQQHNTQNSGKIMDSISAAKESGSITKQEAGQLVKEHLQHQIDGGSTTKDPKAASVGERLKVIDDQQARGSISPEVAEQQRREVMSGLNPEEMRRV